MKASARQPTAFCPLPATKLGSRCEHTCTALLLALTYLRYPRLHILTLCVWPGVVDARCQWASRRAPQRRAEALSHDLHFFRAIYFFCKTLVVPLSTLEPQNKGGSRPRRGSFASMSKSNVVRMADLPPMPGG